MASLSTLVARVPEITATKKGPVINLVSWVSLTTMCLAVVTVLATKLVVLRRLTWNDSFIIAAMAFSIGFTLAINQQVNNGLGSQGSTIDEQEFVHFQKSEYTWNILFILSITFAKLSTMSLLAALAPSRSYRLPMQVTGGIVILWAVASIFASAFQCSLPDPQLILTGKCFGQTGFWSVFGAINIITDVVIMLLPVYLVYKLQLGVRKKLAVCFAFSFRILAVGCTAWRLSIVGKLFDRNEDVTLESWLPTIAAILEVFFAVFASCIPHLRPFMESIQAGYLSGVMTEADPRFGYGNDSYLMGKMARSKAASQLHTMKSEVRGESLELPRQGTNDAYPANTSGIGQALTSNRVVHDIRGNVGSPRDANASGPPRNRSESLGSDGGRSHGSDGSKAMIIKTTKEWSVSYQDA